MRTEPTRAPANVRAAVSDAMPIAQVQGSDASSPYVGTAVTVAGVVTGVQRTGENVGFFLQDATGDRDPLTSDGIYVRLLDEAAGRLDDVAVGARLTASGTVSERGGLTAVEAVTRGALTVHRTPALGPLQPQRLEVPVDDLDRATYLEAREAMLVTIPQALVVGPTNAWGQYVAVDEELHGPRRLGSDADTTGYIHVNGRLGPKPQLTVGDRVEGLRGPIGVTRNQFEVLPVASYKALERGPRPPRAWGDMDGDDRFTASDVAAVTSRIGSPAAGPLDAADLNGDGTISRADLNRLDARIARQRDGVPQLKIATLNAFNFFDAVDAAPPIDDDVPSANAYRTKLAKLAGTIRDGLGTPDVLALQEVENTRVLDDLLARPELAGLGYRYVQLPTTGRRSINPTLLYRAPLGEVLDVRQLPNAGPATELSEDAIHADPATFVRARAPKGPLFSREPLVIDMRFAPEGAEPRELTFVVNHFTSKFSPHGVPTDPIRIEQAKAVRTLVDDLREAHPERDVIVLGDLNDTPDSKALRALEGPRRTPSLVNATATIPPEAERYSYIYDGASELIDHVLVTPGLEDDISRAGVRHGNADLPVGESWDSSPARASDHDSPYVWIAFDPTPPPTR